MDRAAEFKIKHNKIAVWMNRSNVEGVALNRVDSFAWATCGAESHVNTASECGVATLLIVGDRKVVLTNRIEEARMLEEQLAGLPVEIDSLPWQADAEKYIAKQYCSNCVVLTDSACYPGLSPLPEPFYRLMWELTQPEIERYRALGAQTGAALQKACMSAARGMTENELAAIIARNCHENGITPIVILVAADARLKRHRHPLPTGNKIEKTAMAVVCGRRHGLIASCTRMISIGEPPADMMRRHEACIRADAALNAATRPGASAGDIFNNAVKVYSEAGFPGEADLHHQGGMTGYRGRWFFAKGDSSEQVAVNTAWAWNPSITGTKSEDTILVLPEGNEFITSSPGWPMMKTEYNGETFERAGILAL